MGRKGGRKEGRKDPVSWHWGRKEKKQAASFLNESRREGGKKGRKKVGRYEDLALAARGKKKGGTDETLSLREKGKKKRKKSMKTSWYPKKRNEK